MEPPKRPDLGVRQSVFRFAGSKLRLMKNPVDQQHSRAPSSKSVDGNISEPASVDDGVDYDSIPQFVKRETASTFELFYDLWFVANLNVFATVHTISDEATLSSFIGYFLLLWITWLLTTLFDARFGHDGIIERIARAFHLAVMVGFAEVGTTLDRNSGVIPVLRTMSFFLMISRLILSVQYALVLYYARKHPRSRRPLLIATLLHIIPAVVYGALAVLASRTDSEQLIHVWYTAALVEMCVHVAHATFSRTMTFKETVFHERLNLLTLIIIGEGAIILAKNVTVLVDNTYVKHVANQWSPSLIGIVTSATAILYLIYQLYFDWMHHHAHMSVARQSYWVLAHLPFHIALVLLVEGSSQWSVWWRSMEAIQSAATQMSSVVVKGNAQITDQIVEMFRTTAGQLLKLYEPADPLAAQAHLDQAFSALSKIPDSFWQNATDPALEKVWSTEYSVIATTVFNAIHDSFDISSTDDEDSTLGSQDNLVNQTAEVQAYARTASMHRLVFIYVFATAGVVLILLTVLNMLSKHKGWTSFNIFRAAMVSIVGLGLALSSLIAVNDDLLTRFLMTPWQIPMVAICYFVVLILTHLPHPKRFGRLSKLGFVDVERGSKLPHWAQLDEKRSIRG